MNITIWNVGLKILCSLTVKQRILFPKSYSCQQHEMLTLFETKILNCAYNALSKSGILPFAWNGSKIPLKLKRSKYLTLWNIVTSLLLLVVIFFRSKLFRLVIENKDIHGSILNGTLLIVDAAHVVFKLNVHLYDVELVDIISKVFHVNSSWGKNNSFARISL